MMFLCNVFTHKKLIVSLTVLKPTFSLAKRFFPKGSYGHLPKIVEIINNARNSGSKNVENALIEKSSSVTLINQAFNSKQNPSVISTLPSNGITTEFSAQASSMFFFYETLFIATPARFFQNASGINRRMLLYKTMLFINKDPFCNLMLQKKIAFVMIKEAFSQPKGILSGPKSEIKDILSDSYDITKLSVPKEDASLNALFEAYVGLKFSRDQTSVEKITFRSEEPNNNSALDKETSLLFTKQPICDMETTFNTPEGFIKTLQDIVVGVNLAFKGNLSFIAPSKENIIIKETISVLDKIAQLISKANNGNFNDISNSLYKLHNELSAIKNNPSLTLEAKTVLLQERLIDNLSLCRKIDPGFNPNMFVFSPKNAPINEKDVYIVEKIEALLKNVGSAKNNLTDTQMSCIVKSSFQIYLYEEKIQIIAQMPLMNSHERKFCNTLIMKYALEFFEQYKSFLDIS